MSVFGSRLTTGLVAVFLLVFIAVDYAEARRGGGGGGMRGGGMSRSGPAAGGSFNRSFASPARSPSTSRPARNPSVTRPATRPSGKSPVLDTSPTRKPMRDTSEKVPNRDKLQDKHDDRYEKRKDLRAERYDRVDDIIDDRRDWYEDRWRAGAWISLSAWNSMSCTYTTVLVNNITYYDCDGIRYERVYRGSEVTYIIVN